MNNRQQAKEAWENNKVYKTYLFFREDSFYTIDLLDVNDAINNANCNIGTIKVEDAFGNLIWKRN